ncbi:MAG: portal protein [Methanobacteriota archaeon]|nr:MAG: portal protein [Euryarchaeota archaeon]
MILFEKFDSKALKTSQNIIEPVDVSGTVDEFITESNQYQLDFGTNETDTKKLIEQYREMAENSDISDAIDEIQNAAISVSEDVPVSIDLSKVDLSDQIKKKITEEFSNILQKLDFQQYGDEIFREWYIDGRLYYQVIVDQKSSKNGIVELRKIDPRKIKKVRELKKKKGKNGEEIIAGFEDYYIYEDESLSSRNKAIKLPEESVICVTSGRRDSNGNIVSYLHSAIKPFNQLKLLEDSLVVYRVSRAPERRVFYVDTGNLPATRANQYFKKTVRAYQNKNIYDAKTGTIKSNKHILSMMEDIWLPRRNGSRGTEVQTLPGGQNLGEMDDVLYFLKKVYKALKIPASRLNSDSNLAQLGRATEISRDEIKFSQFIDKLRRRFNSLFYETLKRQLLLKLIITEDDWEKIKTFIIFRYETNPIISEQKRLEMIAARADILQSIDQFAGKYLSIDTIRREVLGMSDDDIKHEDKMIDVEMKQNKYGQDNNF